MNETFESYLDEYIRLKEQLDFSLSTIRGAKSSIGMLLSWLKENGIENIKDIKKDDLKSFIKYLIEVKKRKSKGKYKTGTINAIIGRLKSFLLWLDEKAVLKGVITGLHYLKEGEALSRNILTRKEISKLFNIEADTMYEFMIKTIFVLMYSTGLRINELLNVNIKDIDFNNKTILVYESKDKKERYVHLSEVGINYIKIYLAHIRENIAYDAKTKDKLFLSNYKDRSLSAFVVNRHLKIYCKKAGIKKNISTHSFRHSYGSHLLENGAEIKHISELLGHKKLSTTERYTHLSPESLRQVIEDFHPRENEKVLWN